MHKQRFETVWKIVIFEGVFGAASAEWHVSPGSASWFDFPKLMHLHSCFCLKRLTLNSCLFVQFMHSPGTEPVLVFLCSEPSVKEQAAFRKAGPDAEPNHVSVSPEEEEVLLSKRKEVRQPSFLRALLRAFGPYFLIGSAFKLLQDLITFVNPQLLRWSCHGIIPSQRGTL